MATYYVNSGAAGANTGGSWTDAFLTLTQGVAAATANNDVVKVHYTHTETAASTIATAVANIAIIAVNKDSSDALTPMGASGGFTSAASYTILAGAFRVRIYGLTFELTGSAVRFIQGGGADGAHLNYESCLFSCVNTASTSGITLGAAAVDSQSYAEYRSCTFKFGHADQRFFCGRNAIIGGGIDAAGTAPGSQGLFSFARNDPGGAHLTVNGFDLSHLNVTTPTLIADSTTQTFLARLVQCKIPSGLVYLATQTATNAGAGEVWLMDCASGDTHGLFVYANPMGSVVSDTGIYLTAGAAAQSWKIVTTANCSYYTPFETPWFGYYNTVTTAITPYVEILRDGSATAYQDDEVWIDVLAKVTASSTQSSLATDRMTLLGTPANQAAGAGLGSWTGETTTGAPDAWSGKCAVASLTPAEVGHIQARIVVGEPSITVYADPQIRT